MADISKVELNGVTYLVKDAQARKDIEDIKKNGGGGSGGGTGGGASSWEDLGEKNGTIEALAETTWTTPSGEFPGTFKPNTAIFIEADKTYTVNWNGAKYTSVPYINENTGKWALGNPSYAGGGSTTSDPYGIVIENGVITEAYDANMASSVTVSITYEGTKIIPIPTKYLPEPLQFGEEKGGMVEVPVVGEWSSGGGNFDFTEPLGLEVGKTYIVTYDAVDYETVAQGEDGGVVMGWIGEGFEYPFTIIQYQNGLGTLAVANDGSTFVEFSITTEGTVITPIEGKYLPKGTPWIEENGALLKETYATSITHPTFGKMWAIYGGAPNLTVGETYTITYNGVDYKCVCQAAPSGFVPDSNAVAMGNFVPVGGPNTGEPFAMLVSYAGQEVDIIDLVGSASVKVKISGEVHHAEGQAGLFNVSITRNENLEFVSDKSYSEIVAKSFDENLIVRAFFKNDGLQLILPFVGVIDSRAVFSSVLYIDNITATYTVVVNSDGTVETYMD